MTTTGTHDPYAPDADTSAGRVFTVTGQDWDSITDGLAEEGDDHVVVNMGPQHPSTHGVLRLILELDGETVTEARAGPSGATAAGSTPWPTGWTRRSSRSAPVTP